MSLGLAIFLAAAMISIVLLYQTTRTQWNWKKIATTAAVPLIIIVSIISYFELTKNTNSYNDNRTQTAIILITACAVSILSFSYAVNRHRWNNALIGRFLTRIGLGTFAIFILAAGIFYGYKWYLSRPTAQNTYYNLTLNDSIEEVIYRKGPPEFVYLDRAAPPPDGSNGPVYATKPTGAGDNPLPAGKTIRDYRGWGFPAGDGPAMNRIMFFEKLNKLSDIECIDPSFSSYSCAPVLGIHIGDSEESVISKLGKPTIGKIVGEDKILIYQQWNVLFILTRGRVDLLAVGFYRDPSSPTH